MIPSVNIAYSEDFPIHFLHDNSGVHKLHENIMVRSKHWSQLVEEFPLHLNPSGTIATVIDEIVIEIEQNLCLRLL